MSETWYHTWAEIQLDAIEQNYHAVRRLLSPSCKVMAVVKADAYGHGAVSVARRLLAVGADCLAVSNLQEALELRRADITAPILILSYVPPEAAETLAKHHITQTVVGIDHARRLEEAAAAAGVTVMVHIKLDTAMSRVGFFYHHPQTDAAVLDDIAAACRLPHLRAEGCFTHFAVADEIDKEEQTRHQFSLFTTALSELRKRGITFSLRHCCNSAGTLRFPEMHLDMVRPGIILYGVAPSPWMKTLCALQPAMLLKTRVSLVKTVPANTPVSYGGTFTTARESVLATVPVGYGDGMPRALSNRYHVSVGGKAVPIIGKVCMDQCVLDVTAVGGVKEGDVVTVFGDFPTVEDYAAACHTIAYESLCFVGKRVCRAYHTIHK